MIVVGVTGMFDVKAGTLCYGIKIAADAKDIPGCEAYAQCDFDLVTNLSPQKLGMIVVDYLADRALAKRELEERGA